MKVRNHMSPDPVTVGPAATVDQAGAVLAPAAKLAELARAAVGERVSLDLAGDQLRVVFGGSKYHLPTLPAQDFPAAPVLKDPKRLHWDGETLDYVLDTVAVSINNDDPRYRIQGALLAAGPEGSGKVLFVSTDGRRLTKLERANSAAASLGQTRYLLPALAIAALRGLLGRKAGEVVLDLSPKFAALTAGAGRTVTAQLGEGDFPNWEVVVPKNPPIRATLRRLDLLAAARRALIMADAKVPVVVLDLAPGSLVLRAEGNEAGAGEELLPAACERSLSIHTNGRHIVDALEHMASEEIQLDLTDPLNPLLISALGDPGTLFITMPFPPSKQA